MVEHILADNTLLEVSPYRALTVLIPVSFVRTVILLVLLMARAYMRYFVTSSTTVRCDFRSIRFVSNVLQPTCYCMVLIALTEIEVYKITKRTTKEVPTVHSFQYSFELLRLVTAEHEIYLLTICIIFWEKS